LLLTLVVVAATKAKVTTVAPLAATGWMTAVIGWMILHFPAVNRAAAEQMIVTWNMTLVKSFHYVTQTTTLLMIAPPVTTYLQLLGLTPTATTQCQW